MICTSSSSGWTTNSWGLVDFDEVTSGPPLIDWLRLATSASLAAGNDRARTERRVAAFVDGYRRSIEDQTFSTSLRTPAARTHRVSGAMARARGSRAAGTDFLGVLG